MTLVCKGYKSNTSRCYPKHTLDCATCGAWTQMGETHPALFRCAHHNPPTVAIGSSSMFLLAFLPNVFSPLISHPFAWSTFKHPFSLSRFPRFKSSQRRSDKGTGTSKIHGWVKPSQMSKHFLTILEQLRDVQRLELWFVYHFYNSNNNSDNQK